MRKKTKKYLLCFPLITCFLLCPCISLALHSTDYFPLSVGNSWTYKEGNSYFTTKISPVPRYINGVKTTTFQVPEGVEMYFTNDSKGFLVHGGSIPSGNIFTTYNPPMKWANYSPTLNDNIVQIGTGSESVTGIGTFVFDYHNNSKVLAFENISTPLGKFNSIKIQVFIYTYAFINGRNIFKSNLWSLWLAPHLGLVKYRLESAGTSYEGILVNTNVKIPTVKVFMPWLFLLLGD